MLLDVALPLSLAFIMFSLGVGLTFADFGRVLQLPGAVFAGLVMQIAVLPIVAFVALQIVSLPAALAFGVMLLALSPGGVTSNVLTSIAKGNVALSITLTTIVSLLSAITVPILAAWSAVTFLGEAAPEINITKLALTMFAITAVPVAIGVMVRRLAEGFADIIENPASKLSVILLGVIVIAALATNWQLFVDNVLILGPLLVGLNITLLALGLLVAYLLGLSGPDRLCISIELGVQNATVGITLAGLIAASAGLSEYALPSAVYGITMYLVTIPAIFVMRRIVL